MIFALSNCASSVFLEGFQRLTQRSVKYIRWLRAYLYVAAPLAEVLAKLRASYAKI
jgi:hypothetical protein